MSAVYCCQHSSVRQSEYDGPMCLAIEGVYVENLSTFVVRDTAEVLSLLKLGKKKLIIAETRMNRVSSR